MTGPVSDGGMIHGSAATRVPLSTIKEQRDADPSWPDLHPEDYCHRCGTRNISWFVQSDLWNEAWAEAEGGGYQSVLCVACFAELWERATGTTMTWELRPDGAVLLARMRRAGWPR